MKIQIKKSLLTSVSTWSLAIASVFTFCMTLAYATPSLTGTAGLKTMVQDTTQSMGYISVAIIAFCVVAGPVLMATGLLHLHKHFSQQQSGQSSIAKPITEIAVGAALLFSVYLVYTLGSSVTGGTSAQSDVQYMQESGIAPSS